VNSNTEDVSEIVLQLRAIRAAVETAARMPAELIGRDELAALMDLGVSTLDRMKAARQIGPAELRLGGAVKWHFREVLMWLSHPTPAGELYDAKAWTPIWAELQKRNAKN